MNATGEGVKPAPLMKGHAPHDVPLRIINELARMSPLDYAQAKKARAAELGLSLSDLEKAVRAARKQQAKADVSAEDDDGKPSQADTLVHIINELACMSPLDYAQAKKARAAELGLAQADLAKAVNERRKALKAQAVTSTQSAEEQDGIWLRTGDRPRITDDAFGVIRRDGSLYRRGGVIVCLDGNRTIGANEAFLADFLERRTRSS